jgi:hypothetical protein
MTIEVMKFYIHSLLSPYVKSLRNQLSDQSLNVYRVADNHGTNDNPDLLAVSKGLVLSQSGGFWIIQKALR